MIVIDVAMLGFISGSLIPLVTGLLTKVNAPSGLKAIFSAFLSAVTAVVANLTDFNGVAGWKETVILFFVTWIAHAGVYHGFWKPTGISGSVASSTGTVGIG